jgi:sterol 14alpha-demethylase
MTTVMVPLPPAVSGGEGEHGHLEELRRDPIGLMWRLREECGEVGSFDLAGRSVVLLSGAELNEWYFRTPDDVLDQGAAYPFMTPIFGQGVVFDAPPERRAEMLKNSSLRGPQMKGHAEVIAAEVERMVADWEGDASIDLLDFFAELTIYTSSSCLIGKRFREQLDDRFARLYHDLERGTDALAYVDPYAPIESFRKRDESRVELVKLVEEIMATRVSDDPPPGDPDLLDLLMSIKDEGRARFNSDEITGMFISMMFAGHHTTSGTAAWTLIELLRQPDELAAVVDELDALYADGSSVSFQALRAIPRLEAAIKEALRLHPPLILLLRVATADLEVGGFAIKQGDLVAVSPAVSNRLRPDFPDPDDFAPVRYLDPRKEDDRNPWTWIPFGGGRHRCVGAAFALMQLKAIFSVLLRDYTFALAQPSDTYRNDHSKMVVQLQQPCAVTVTPRTAQS